MLELRGVEHVGLEDGGACAEALRELFERLAPAREEADLRARRGEAARDRSAEHARRARHDRDPAVEAEQVGEGGGGHAPESSRPARHGHVLPAPLRLGLKSVFSSCRSGAAKTGSERVCAGSHSRPVSLPGARARHAPRLSV